MPKLGVPSAFQVKRWMRGERKFPQPSRGSGGVGVTWATLSDAAHASTEAAKAKINVVLINLKIRFRQGSLTKILVFSAESLLPLIIPLTKVPPSQVSALGARLPLHVGIRKTLESPSKPTKLNN